MLKYFLLSLILFIPSNILADETTDKAEFKKLYAEFNDLYANSEAIDPIIEVAEKLYKLAPKVYGKRSQNTAIVTYNLATLYDEKGDEGPYNNPNEKKASNLYEKYFRLQKRLGVEVSEVHLKQYIQYMVSYYHSHVYRARSTIAEDMLDIAKSLKLESIERADLEYYAAILIADFVSFELAIPHFQNALKTYLSVPNSEYLKAVKLNIILAQYDNFKNKNDAAIRKLLTAVKIFDILNYENHPIKSYVYRRLAYYYEVEGNMEEKEKFQDLNRRTSTVAEPILKLPIPIKRANPYYPASAAENGLNGFVKVRFTVDKNGRTKNLEAIDFSNKIFVKNSLAAAAKYQYEPPTIDGKKTELHGIEIRIEFQLSSTIGGWRTNLPEQVFVIKSN